MIQYFLLVSFGVSIVSTQVDELALPGSPGRTDEAVSSPEAPKLSVPALVPLAARLRHACRMEAFSSEREGLTHVLALDPPVKAALKISDDTKILTLVAGAVDAAIRDFLAASPELKSHLSLHQEIQGRNQQKCARICRDGGEPIADGINYCALEDPGIAVAAELVDPDAARRIQNLLAELEADEKALDYIADKSGKRAPHEFSPFDLPLFAGAQLSDLVERALAGLARAIEDRAKLESLGWVVDRLTTDLCELDPAAPNFVKEELRLIWLRHLCSLASEQRLGEYGAGAALVQAVRSAIIADISALPGHVAGLTLAGIFWKAPASIGNPLQCGDSSETACVDFRSMRASAANAVDAVLAGTRADRALYDLGTELAATSQEEQRKIFACGISAPHVIEAFSEPVRASLGSGEQAAEALFLIAATGAPACFSLIGQGCDRNWDPQTACEPAGDTPSQAVERLSTIIRLARVTSGRVHELALKAQSLHAAIEQLNRTIDAKDPKVAAGRESDQSAGSGAESPPSPVQEPQLLAGTLVLESATRLAGSFVDVLRRLKFEGGFGGGREISGNEIAKLLARIEEISALLRAAASEDWAGVAIRAIGHAEEQYRSHCGETCSMLTTRLARYSGMLSAIATAQDSDAAARAIDAAAEPAGAWRLKARSGVTTWSITAHPGAFLIGTESRWGQYGADYESGRPHLQYAQLAAPIGVEVTRGTRFAVNPVGLFISFLDPAGFVNHDEQGRLPDPRPLTAVALGGGLRMGIAGTPISVLAVALFRPQLRALDAGWSGPSANAFQAGVALSVDVTLVTLRQTGSER